MARKVALVTGSGTGVGRACAVRFAQLGYAVAVNYSRSESDARETAGLVEAAGAPALVCRANVADDAAVREMVARIVGEFGGLDVLVNNAATTRFIPHADLDALTDEVWDDIFRVNVKGVLHCCRAAMPHLGTRNGSVVNVASVAGLTGQGSSVPYCASKGAVIALTKSLARAFGPAVRVNAVAPGPILTRWLAGRDQQIDGYVSQTATQRASTPDDIADTVVFLATSAAQVTGQILVVDGGRSM